MEPHRFLIEVSGPEAPSFSWGRCEVNGADAGPLDVAPAGPARIRVLSPPIAVITAQEVTFVLGRYADDPEPQRIVVYQH